MTWRRFARRSHAPLSARLLQEAQQSPYFPSATGIGVGLRNHVWVDDTIYIPQGEQTAVEGAVRLQLGDDWSFVDDFCRRCRSALDGLTLESRRIGQVFSTSALTAVEQWLQAYRAAMAFVPVFRNLDRVLAERVSTEDAATYLDESRQSDTAEARERSHLEAIAAQLRSIGDDSASSPTADRLLAEHAATFGWLRVRWYLGRPFTIDDFRDRVAAMLALPARPPSAAVESEAELTSDRSRMLAGLALLRTQRAEVINEAIWRATPTLDLLARSLDIDYLDLVHLLPGELVDGVRSGSIDPSLARERMTGFATALIDDEFQTFAGPTEVQGLLIRLGIEPSAVSGVGDRTDRIVLRGSTASRGEATGLVRIVRTAEEADHLQAGEILVTTMTYPSMIGAMQRAGAIVTDDGGLLSHAAITARELDKPCVIGVGSATTDLRTGDLVQVDANEATIIRLNPIALEGTT